MDKKTQDAIEGINNGTFANQLKNNIKYTLTGLAIGGAIGIIVASLTGRCRLCFGFWGAIAGGSIGYISSKKIKDKNFNCCL